MAGALHQIGKSKAILRQPQGLLEQAVQKVDHLGRLLSTWAVLLASPAAAESFGAQYRATLAGLTVGKARLAGVVVDGAYEMRLKGETSMLGFSNRFEAVATGKSRNATLVPQSYQLSLRGRQVRTVAISFSADRATQIVIDPQPTAAELQGRLPIELQHQVAVLDPLTGLMSQILRASQATNPCEGATRVLSGRLRFDVSFAASDQASSDQTSGEIVCRATYRLVAGHKPDASASAPPTITVAFPRAASDGGLRLPSRIEFPLRLGTVVIRRVI